MKFEKLYETLYAVAKAEIVPTYEGRPKGNSLSPLDYLNSADGRIEQILLSYLDADRTDYDYTETAFDQAKKDCEQIITRLEKLHDTIKQIDVLIVSEQVELGKIFEQVLTESLSEELQAKGESIKAKIRKYKWLRVLLADYEKVLIQDYESNSEVFQEEYRKMFGKRLRQTRKDGGLSIAHVTRTIGMTQVGYYRYEQGLREPTAATLYKLCKVLNVSADYLLGLQ